MSMIIHLLYPGNLFGALSIEWKKILVWILIPIFVWVLGELITFAQIPQLSLSIFIPVLIFTLVGNGVEGLIKAFKIVTRNIRWTRFAIHIALVMELFLTFAVLQINPVISGDSISFISIASIMAFFWIVSGYMRVGLQASELIFREDLKDCLLVTELYGKTRSAYFITAIVIPFIYLTDIVQLLFYLVPLMIILPFFYQLFLRHALTYAIKDNKDVRENIKILRHIGYSPSPYKQIKHATTKNKNELDITLRRLQNLNLIKHIGHDYYELSDKFKGMTGIR